LQIEKEKIEIRVSSREEKRAREYAGRENTSFCICEIEIEIGDREKK